MLLVTTVGSPWVIAPIAMVVAAGALWAGQRRIGAVLLLACAGSILTALLKFVPRRVRPDTPYVQDMPFKTYSFPSDHAFSALVLMGLAAYFSWTLLPLGLSLFIVPLLVVLALAVGFSRIYVGAHYTLDVLAGWMLGGLMLTLLITVLVR